MLDKHLHKGLYIYIIYLYVYEPGDVTLVSTCATRGVSTRDAVDGWVEDPRGQLHVCVCVCVSTPVHELCVSVPSTTHDDGHVGPISACAGRRLKGESASFTCVCVCVSTPPILLNEAACALSPCVWVCVLSLCPGRPDDGKEGPPIISLHTQTER